MGKLKLHWNHYRVSLRLPLSLKGETQTFREGLWVCLEDGEGGRGWGEVAPLPQWHRESLEDCQKWLKRWQGDEEALLEAPPSVAFGISTAQSWLEARKSGQSLEEYLFSQKSTADKVEVQGLLPRRDWTDPALLERLKQCTTWKVKLSPQGLEKELQLIEELVTQSPHPVQIRCDGNRLFTLEELERVAPRLQKLPLEYLEEPLAHWQDCERFYETTGIPYCLDESLLQWPWERPWPQGCCGIVLKPALFGTLSTSLRWIQKAQREQKKVVLSSLWDGPVALFVYLCLAFGVGGGTHGLATYLWWPEETLWGEWPTFPTVEREWLESFWERVL